MQELIRVPTDTPPGHNAAHGVPGSAIVVLAATLQAVPAIPARTFQPG